MPQFRPLFVTGTARCGGSLIARMLSANSQVMVAVDPFLELFRSLRNAAVRHYAPADALALFDPASPLQDYYFTDARIKLMDAVQQADLGLPFEPQEWEGFLDRGARRCALVNADLARDYADIRAATYKGIVENALAIIARTRGADRRTWVGFKDVWTIEFLRPLAAAFPDARFIIVSRDPRATLHSNLGADPLTVGEPLSYVRHWRKQAAFTVEYRNDPLFVGRLFVVAYEQVLQTPEQKARELCEFLDVDYEPGMLDTNTYFDFATGTTWRGNSSFEKTTSGLNTHAAARWRSMLNPKVSRMVEFLCEYDMTLTGDGPLDHADGNGRWPSADILECIIESSQGSWNWRSDLGDPQQDYGFELFRRALLHLPEPPSDPMLVRRSFLFDSVYERLRQIAVARAAA